MTYKLPELRILKKDQQNKDNYPDIPFYPVYS